MKIRVLTCLILAMGLNSGLALSQSADSLKSELEALRRRLKTIESAHERDMFNLRTALQMELHRMQAGVNLVSQHQNGGNLDSDADATTVEALSQIADQVRETYFESEPAERAQTQEEISGFGDFLDAAMQERLAGLAVDAVYTSETSANMAGGLRRGVEYLDNVDLTVELDGEMLFGWPGSTLFLYVLGNNGGSPTENIGDAQGASNIDTDDTWKLYEAWVQQQFFSDRVSVLAGLYDLNGEFDVIETAGLFLNSSHGIGPDFSQTGLNGPSIFPTTSLGFRLKLQPSGSFYIQSVILDGVAGNPDRPGGTQIKFGAGDGVLIGAEATYVSGADEKDNQPFTKVALGAHYYTSKFDAILQSDLDAEPGKIQGRPGIYLLAERSILREKGDPAQGLAVFGRVGFADSRIYQFGAYSGGGLVYTGLLPGRDEDQFGAAIAVAHNGGEFQETMRSEGTPVDNSEVALEFTYRLHATPWLAIQPDFQYIVNPGTDSALANAFAGGARFELAF